MKPLLKIFSQAEFYIQAFCQPERGATATEYGILLGFIAMVIVAGIGAFGIALNGVFGGLATGIQIALGIP